MKIVLCEGYPDIEITIRCPEVTEAVQKIVSLLRASDKKLSGVKDGKTHILDGQNAFYFESLEKRCFIYTAEDVYETPLRLYEIEEYLTDMGFLRCSKSLIVNIAKIASLCPDFGGRMEATLENGEKLIISRQYTKILKERLGLR